jgi:hypothetical protein
VAGSSKRLPIRRLVANKVFSGLVTPYDLVSSRKATYLTFGRDSAETLTILSESDDRRGSALAFGKVSYGCFTFGVLDDFGVVAFHDGDAGVGGAEIDSDDAVGKDQSRKVTRSFGGPVQGAACWRSSSR